MPRIRSALGQLISSQQDDGGWTWTGHGKGSHRFTSARVVWALAMARKAGYKLSDDQFEKAKSYLQSQIVATAETDFESKAMLLHAARHDRQRRFHAGQPALSQPPGAEQLGAGVPGAGLRRDGSQADGGRTAWRCWASEISTIPRRAARLRAVRCPGALRRSNCGRSMRLALEQLTPEAAEDERNHGLADGPSHRPSLVAGKSDRPGRRRGRALVRPHTI